HLGKLLLQQRHEHLVEREPKDRGLIGWAPGVGAVIDRLLTMRNALDREHGKLLDLVVVAGVIAKRALGRVLARTDEPFEHDFGVRRNLQVVAQALHELGATAAQQPRKGIFGERIGDRSHCRQRRRWVSTEYYGEDRK